MASEIMIVKLLSYETLATRLSKSSIRLLLGNAVILVRAYQSASKHVPPLSYIAR